MISDVKAIGIILSTASGLLIVSIIIIIIHRIHWKRVDRSRNEGIHLVSSTRSQHHHHHHQHHHLHRPLPPHHHQHRTSAPAQFLFKSPKRELLSSSTPEFLGKAAAVEEAKPKLIVKQRTLPTVPEKHSDFQPEKTKPGHLGISNPFFNQNVDEDETSPKLFQAKTAQRIQPRSSLQFPASWKSYSFDSARSSITSAPEESPYLLEDAPRTADPQKLDQFKGKIHLSLDFEKSTQKLTIAILRATDLPNCEYTGTADPYVKLDMLNDYGLQASYQTKIQRKTLNPIFNEKFTVWCEGVSSYQIQVSIYDFDRFSRHRLIGYAVFEEVLASRHGGQSGGCKDVVMELNRDYHQEKSHNLGQLLVSLRYLPTAGRLTVSIIKALGLSNHCGDEEEEHSYGLLKGGDDDDDDKNDGADDDPDDAAGMLEEEGDKSLDKSDKRPLAKSCMPDPYVKVTLMCHGRQVRKRKTSTKHSTVEPVYNESINFDVPQESIDQVHVDIRVHSKGSPSSKMLGACAIGPQFLGTSRDHWTAMLQYPRKPVAKWYQLSPYVKS